MKHIVITGGSRGIGFALARRFLELGCRVTIAGRSETTTNAALERLNAVKNPGALHGRPCDVTRTEQLEALWEHAATQAPVDVWINNAGVSPPFAMLWDVPAKALEDVIDSNVRGALMGSWTAMRGMRKQGSGVIYNIVGFGSDGLMYPGALAYGASKRAVGYVTKALGREAKGTGVRVCAMDPGAVHTDMVAATWTNAATTSKFMSAFIMALAVQPEEVARLLAPRLLANHASGAIVRPWNALVAWFRLLLVPLYLLRGQGSKKSDAGPT